MRDHQELADEGIQERLLPNSENWETVSGDHVARYLHAVDFIKGKRVLDAGTGYGYGSALLRGLGAAHVQAVDIDEPTISKARELYPVEGIEFIVDNCETLSKVRGPIDVVCNFENIEHLAHPERFVEVAARLLTDDGILLCSSPDRATSVEADGKPVNPYHVQEWFRDDFHALFSKHFHEVEIFTQVASSSHLARKEAVANLREHLNYFWSEPLPRVTRAIKKLAGQSRPWLQIEGLAAPSISDFPIVPNAIANILGKAHSHYAICRNPRR